MRWSLRSQAKKERERWREFAPIAGEPVTAEDASHTGLPAAWYEHFVQDHFKGGQVRAEQLRFAIDDPSIRDLLRFKIEQRQLREDLAEVLDDQLNPYDAVAAGVARRELVTVVREAFEERSDVTVGELIPEIQRRAVRDFLIGADGRPSIARVRRALAQAAERKRALEQLGPIKDRQVDLSAAIQSGAADESVRSLARAWFGEATALSVEQLLLASKEPAFARLLGWKKMMCDVR